MPLFSLDSSPLPLRHSRPKLPVPKRRSTARSLVTADPDGAGELFTLTADVRTYATITLPNDATLDGNGHSITAVEDADHRNFPGPVLASAVGDSSAPARLDLKNLDIRTLGFEGGSNSNGLLNGIYMYRAGGSLTNVSVEGISHGNGVQEGNAISIRNRVSGDNIDVPRAQVTLTDVDVTNYQKTGLLLDGNLGFAVKRAHVGQGTGPTGEPNPTIAANSLQISRGATGSVTDSSFKLNAHEQGTAALLYNARTIDFERVTIDGVAPATVGINVSNSSNTIDTHFTMRGGAVTRTATPAAGTGLATDGPADSISANTIDTRFSGWASATSEDVASTTTPTTKPDDEADHSRQGEGQRQGQVPREPPLGPAPAGRHAGVQARRSPGRGQDAQLDDQGRRPLGRLVPSTRWRPGGLGQVVPQAHRHSHRAGRQERRQAAHVHGAHPLTSPESAFFSIATPTGPEALSASGPVSFMHAT